METEQIIRLMEAASKLGLTKVKYQEGDVKLVLESRPEKVAMAPVQQMVIPAVDATTMQDTAVEASNAEGETNIVKSPLVGTFYSAPSEDAEPFVTVGDTVKKGQIIGIIETMKLMNEVECDRDGVVAEILIENEQVVEFGQPLLAIR